MQSYNILRIINIPYEEIFSHFFLKTNSSIDDNYSEILKKFKNQSYSYLNSFEERMAERNNKANLVVYNFEMLQKRWFLENVGDYKSLNSEEDKLYRIFCAQINFYKPDVLFFQHSSPFDLLKLEEIKLNYPFIRKIIFHNGILINDKNLKFVDNIFATIPYLKKFYKSKGIKSDLVYHYFDESILTNISNNICVDQDLNFLGKTGRLDDQNHLNRFNFLKKVLSEKKINFECYSLEKTRDENNNKITFKLIFRNSLLKIITYFPKYMINLLKKSKNHKIINLINDINKDTKQIFLHKIYKKKIKKSLYGLDMFREIKRSKLILNIHTNESYNECGNLRMFETTGIGSCLITEKTKNLGDLFSPDEEVLTYENYDEFKSKYLEILKNDKLLNQIRLKGQKKTLEHHTTKSRVEEIDILIKDALKN